MVGEAGPASFSPGVVCIEAWKSLQAFSLCSPGMPLSEMLERTSLPSSFNNYFKIWRQGKHSNSCREDHTSAMRKTWRKRKFSVTWKGKGKISWIEKKRTTLQTPAPKPQVAALFPQQYMSVPSYTIKIWGPSLTLCAVQGNFNQVKIGFLSTKHWRQNKEYSNK